MTGSAAHDEQALLHDASTTCILSVSGKHRVDLLQRLTTNDLKKVEVGLGQTNVFTTNKGRIVDWVRILPFDESLLLLASAGNGAALRAWIDRYTITEDITIEDVSDRHRLFHLLGARAVDVAAGIDAGVASGPPNGFRPVEVDGHESILVKTEGLVAHSGFLVLVRRADADAVLAALVARGARAIDDATFEALRVEHGLPRFGADLGEDFHPLEAGLWSAVSFAKGCYVGQEVIARLNTYDKVTKNLARLRLSQPAKPGDRILQSKDGKDVGVLTSVAGPPQLAEWRALGYVKKRCEAELIAGAPGATGSTNRVEVGSVVRV